MVRGAMSLTLLSAIAAAGLQPEDPDPDEKASGPGVRRLLLGHLASLNGASRSTSKISDRTLITMIPQAAGERLWADGARAVWRLEVTKVTKVTDSGAILPGRSGFSPNRRSARRGERGA